MPDYRRILSYLYRYEDGNKKNCTGYVKAEQRNHILKMTLQIQDARCPMNLRAELGLYRYKEEKWIITSLIQMDIESGKEITYQFALSSLSEEFDLKEQYGVLISCGARILYGSVWIGEDIPVDELAESLQSETCKKESSEEKSSEEKSSEEKPSEEKPFEKELAAEESAAEEPVREESVKEESAKVEIVKKYPDKGEFDTEEPGNEKDTNPKPNMADLLEPVRDQAHRADNIHNSAFYEGYQLNRSQLSHLSEEADMLSLNQFLLKGYEHYHHLLAGKVRYDGTDRFCIGVPGTYENREKYMAQLYGFPIFLSLTEDHVKTGKPGYWLHLLSV